MFNSLIEKYILILKIQICTSYAFELINFKPNHFHINDSFLYVEKLYD